MAATSFPDLAVAQAAFSLGNGNVWFSCAVCGKKHKAGAGAWKNCSRDLANAWGVTWWDKNSTCTPEAALNRAF